MAERASRASHEKKRGSRSVSAVLAENIRVLRASRGITQRQLADRMTALGYGWPHQIASQVENCARSVTADELLGLALVLETSVSQLLDPHGFDKKNPVHIDMGSAAPLDPDVALDLITGDGVFAVEWEENPTRVTWGRVVRNPSFTGLLNDLYQNDQAANDEGDEDERTPQVRETATSSEASA